MSFAAQPALEEVDIYLSAGPRELSYAYPPPPDFRSCSNDDTANCTLYRLRWNKVTKSGVVEPVDRARHIPIGSVQTDVGYIQPAVSPNGRWLLYVAVTTELDASGRRARTSALIQRSADLTEPREIVFTRAAGSAQPQYPVWIGGHGSGRPFLWNSSTGVGPLGSSTVWQQVVSTFDYQLRYFGPGRYVGGTSATSYEDANFHAHPADRGGPGLVTFGGAVGTPAAYNDLTSWIEDFELATPGSFNAAFSTSHAPWYAP